MPRTRDEKAFAAKQQEILRAAEALFVAQGFHQTGMAAICEAAEMSPGTLYRYFESKADIIQAFVAEEQAETAKLFEYLSSARDFKAALVEGLVAALIEVSDQDYGRLALEVAAEAARDDKIGEIVATAEQQALDQFTEVIRNAQQRDDIASTLSASSCAQVLWMMINGATGSNLKALSKRRLKPVIVGVVEGLLGTR